MAEVFHGLNRKLERFINGLDEVERLIGKDFSFHDANMTEFHVSNSGEVTMEIVTWSDIDYDRTYLTKWKLSQCTLVECYNWDPSLCYLYELRFDTDPYYEDRIKVTIDGVGPEITCKHIDVTVEEIELDSDDDADDDEDTYNRATRAEQIAEAVERMRNMGMQEDIVTDFEEGQNVQIYEPPYGCSYYPDEEEDAGLLKEIERLEKSFGMLVWGVIRCTMTYNRQPVTIDCIMTVSGNKDEWVSENQDLFDEIPFAYTICKEYPSLKDHGHIEIYMSEGGTPLRKG